MLESGKVMIVERQSESFLDRGIRSPQHGGFGTSNIVEGTIKKVHTDEANNVTFTCDVVTQKGEQKSRVPILFPFANATGTAGIWSVPNQNDRCLIALGPGNTAYIMGFHAAPQLSESRGTPTLKGESPLKATFGVSQLIPGAIELRTAQQNRILLHPGGSIAIDVKTDLFTFYNAVNSTIQTLARSLSLTTAGGRVLWKEGDEKAQRSMKFEATLYTKAATKENLDKGSLRGGARMSMIFSEFANHFFLEVKDTNDITSGIKIGPDGIILTSGNGITQGSIAVSPNGNFLLIAGSETGPNTKLSLAPDAISIAAFLQTTPMATVVAETRGVVTISSDQEVKVQAPKVTIDAAQATLKGGFVNLGGMGGFGAARYMDQVAGSCPAGTVIAQIMTASPTVAVM